MVELYVQPNLTGNLMALHVVQHSPLVKLQSDCDARLFIHSPVDAADVSSVELGPDVKCIK
jgi:hypothetical protein